jgi:hypothetical protein
MSKKNNNQASSLDLGLGAILADAQASKEQAPQAETPTPTEIITLDDAAGELRHEFSTLAQAKQWGVLVSKAETAISSEQDFEARLWWIRGHLGALSLPVSLLAAPFETLCRQLQTRPEARNSLSELVSEVGQIMIERLKGVGDRRQEHGVRHALTQLGVLGDNRGQSTGPQVIPPKVPRFELGTPAGESDLSQVPAGLLPRRKRGGARWVVVGALATFLLAAVGLYYKNRNLDDAQVVVASESFVQSDSATAQISPVVSARAVTGSLGALYYSITEATPAAVAASSARPPAPVGTSEAGRSPAMGVAARSEPAPNKPAAQDKPIAARDGDRSRGAKEQVNTVGPVEGAEFRDGVERRSMQEPRLPSVTGGEIQPEPRPSASLPEIDGVLRGEVRSVLVPTNVLASPNYHARIIARLREGDKVSVEARVGQWVRIRSRKGKTGFIFAQDVGESEDFTASDGQ